MNEQGQTRIRLRIHFAKQAPLRFTSHLDLARIWERLLRRAAVGVHYSQGFNPRPKLQLAAALPLGYTSQCEVLDIWLAHGPPPVLDVLMAEIQAKAPAGLEITHIEEVDTRSPALQTLTRQATYQIELADNVDVESINQSIARLLASDSVMRKRRDKHYDLRPLIFDVDVSADSRHPVLTATLALRDGGTGRPDELLDALGLNTTNVKVERVAITFANPEAV